MKTVIAAAAALLGVSAAHAAGTPYQAGTGDGVCNGQTACKLTFPVVPAGKMLTIDHISCSVTTSGEQGGVNTLLLGTVNTASPIDFLSADSFLNGSNIRALANLPTLFYVKAGDQPEVAASGNGTIVSGSSDGCFISGTMQAQ